MMPPSTNPLARLFSAQVLAGDPQAVENVKRALIRNGGNIQKAAAELGVGERTLHRWGDDLPHIKKIVDEHGRGRIGRGPGKPKEPPKKAPKRAKKATP